MAVASENRETGVALLDRQDVDLEKFGFLMARMEADPAAAEELAAYCQEFDISVQDIVELGGFFQALMGEVSGVPAPVSDHVVVMAEGHRRARDWDGSTLGPSEASSRECGSGVREDETLRNEWFSQAKRTKVHVVWRGLPERQVWRGDDRVTLEATPGFEVRGFFFKHGPSVEPIFRWKMTLDTLHAGSQAWTAEAEITAMDALRSLLSEQQWRTYVTCGAFIEGSKASQAQYLFRKGLPTVVMLPSETGSLVPSCTLCLHPLAYYRETFAGGMVPTDDVIAHLMHMRADEHGLWRRANQHPIGHRASGV